MKTRWMTVLLALVWSTAAARTTSYAIAIGNNAPPVRGGAGLPVLRFADDDAVRNYQFFGRFVDEARLLSVLDEQTRKRYPQPVSAVHPPTLDALVSTVRQFAARVKADLERGDQPVVYISFSGHGGRLPDGTAFLALADGELTKDRLRQDVLAPLSNAFVHLFVDACNAESVVGSRGLFEREEDARASAVTDSDASHLAEAAGLGFARVGTLVATSMGKESYEWSQIESGVFTHELLSGLAGAADVNGDGHIEYGEIQAFLAAANRDLENPRARPQVVSHAPRVNPRLPIVSLAPLRDVAFLVGDFSQFGHFHMELSNGQRYLDAHLSSEVAGRIAFPANQQVFLMARNREAPLSAKPGETRAVESLRFRAGSETARGSIESSFRNALFASAFGSTYQNGFLDGQGSAPLPWEMEGMRVAATIDYRKPFAIGAFTVSGLSLVASATTSILALRAKHDYDRTDIQREASDARDRFLRYRTAAIVTGAGALAAGAAGWLLWPKDEGRIAVTPLLLGDGAAIAIAVDIEKGLR